MNQLPLYRSNIQIPQPSIQDSIGEVIAEISAYDPSIYENFPLQIKKWRRGELYTNPRLRVFQESPPEHLWAEMRRLDIRSGNQAPAEQGISSKGTCINIVPNEIGELGINWIGGAAKAGAEMAEAGVKTSAQVVERTGATIAKGESVFIKMFAKSKEAYNKARTLIIQNPKASLGTLITIAGIAGVILWFQYGETFGIPNRYLFPAIGILIIYTYRKELKKALKKKKLSF